MRTGAAAVADAPTCASERAGETATGNRTPIDGRYRIHTTAADLRAAGAPESDINPGNYGSYEVVLDRGRFSIGQPRAPRGGGTCTVVGNTVTLTVYTARAAAGAAIPASGSTSAGAATATNSRSAP